MAGDAPEALRIVVVDDERLAREELCYLLGQVGGVDVVAQAADGLDALEAIKNTGPDLVLLDVQMPGLTGFEVARRLLENGADTHIVFVTAFDRHAIEAFEVDAVDYLLKPVEVDRLGTAVDRVRRRIHTDRPSAVPRPRNWSDSCNAWRSNSTGGSSWRSKLPTVSCWFTLTTSSTPRWRTM